MHSSIFAAFERRIVDHEEQMEGTEVKVDGLFTQTVEREVKGVYALATEGAKTERCGSVVDASSTMVIDGHSIAGVGDAVRYPDGTDTRIIAGTGVVIAYKNRPMTIVGSETENGDRIVSSLQKRFLIAEFVDERIPGLLDPCFRPKEQSTA